MSTPASSVVQREVGWLKLQPGVTAAVGDPLPYVRRPSGSDNRRAMLRRTSMNLTTHDSGHDAREHALLLIVDWPAGKDLLGAQSYLDQAVELLVNLLRGDRTHGGLWATSADSGNSFTPDVTVTWTDPDDPVLAASDGRLQALIAYTVTEIVPRPVPA